MRGSSPRMTRELRSLRPRLCSAPLREELRAALRPGHTPHALSVYKSSTTYGPPPVEAREENSTKREAMKLRVGK